MADEDPSDFQVAESITVKCEPWENSDIDEHVTSQAPKFVAVKEEPLEEEELTQQEIKFVSVKGEPLEEERPAPKVTDGSPVKEEHLSENEEEEETSWVTDGSLVKEEHFPENEEEQKTSRLTSHMESNGKEAARSEEYILGMESSEEVDDSLKKNSQSTRLTANKKNCQNVISIYTAV